MEALSIFFVRLLVTLKLNPFYCFFYFRCWRWRWPFATESEARRETLFQVEGKHFVEVSTLFINSVTMTRAAGRKNWRTCKESFPSLTSPFLLNWSEVRITNKSVPKRWRVSGRWKVFRASTKHLLFLLSFQVFNDFSIVSQYFQLFVHNKNDTCVHAS